ncbi:hypothetical protein CAOG_002115 [Capsaspora owczarzaki ATCC 30864]|uniref:Uncharacterized protein n=1 Tax=Capsaspora owczarzaki (strain ATCC 30864) TaxID=595528 RepID=A0A0D2VL93_CAPO3|nr:hypothetical protein CAOG_002115 [Capsaspora owczarzaki ATCC 30864]
MLKQSELDIANEQLGEFDRRYSDLTHQHERDIKQLAEERDLALQESDASRKRLELFKDTELDIYQSSLSQYDRRLSELNRNNSAAETRCVQLQEQVAELTNALERTSTEYVAIEKELQEQIQAQQQQCDDTEQKHATLTATHQSVVQECAMLRDKLVEHEQIINEMNELIDATLLERDAFARESEERKATLDNLQTKFDALNAAITALTEQHAARVVELETELATSSTLAETAAKTHEEALSNLASKHAQEMQEARAAFDSQMSVATGAHATELAAIQQTQSNLEEQIATLMKQLDASNAAVQTLTEQQSSEMLAHHSSTEEQVSMIAALNARLASVQAENAAQAAALEASEQELQDANGAIAFAQQQHKDAVDQLSASHADAMDQLAAQHITQVAELEQTLQESAAEAIKLTDSIATHQARLDEAARTIEQLSTERDAVSGNLSAVTAELQSLKATHITLSATIDQLAASKSQISNDAFAANRELLDLQLARDGLVMDLAAANEQASLAREAVQKLQSEFSAFREAKALTLEEQQLQTNQLSATVRNLEVELQAAKVLLPILTAHEASGAHVSILMQEDSELVGEYTSRMDSAIVSIPAQALVLPEVQQVCATARSIAQSTDRLARANQELYAHNESLKERELDLANSELTEMQRRMSDAVRQFSSDRETSVQKQQELQAACDDAHAALQRASEALDATQAERETLRQRASDMAKQIEASSAVVQQQAARAEELERAMAAMTEQLKDAQSLLRTKEDEVSGMAARQAELSAKHESTTQQLAQQCERASQLEASLNEATAAVQSLTLRCQETEQRADQLDQELAKATDQLAQESQRMESLTSKCESAEERVQELDGELAEASERVQDLTVQVQELVSNASKHAEQLELNLTEAKEKDSLLEALTSSVEQLRELAVSRQQALDELSAKLQREQLTSMTLDEQQQKLQEALQSLSAASAKIEQLESQIVVLRGQLDERTLQVHDSKQESAAASVKLQSAESALEAQQILLEEQATLCQKQEQEVAHISQELQTATLKYAQTAEQLEEQRRAFSESRAQFEESAAKSEALETQLGTAMSELRASVDSSIARADSAERKCAQLTAELAAVTSHLDSEVTQSLTLTNQVEALGKSLTEAHSERNAMQKLQIEQLNKMTADSNAHVEELQQEMLAMQAQMEAQYRTAAELAKQLEATQQVVSELTATRDQLSATLSSSRQDSHTLAEKHRISTDDLDAMQQSLSSKTAELEQFKLQLNQATASLQALHAASEEQGAAQQALIVEKAGLETKLQQNAERHAEEVRRAQAMLEQLTLQLAEKDARFETLKDRELDLMSGELESLNRRVSDFAREREVVVQAHNVDRATLEDVRLELATTLATKDKLTADKTELLAALDEKEQAFAVATAALAETQGRLDMLLASSTADAAQLQERIDQAHQALHNVQQQLASDQASGAEQLAALQAKLALVSSELDAERETATVNGNLLEEERLYKDELEQECARLDKDAGEKNALVQHLQQTVAALQAQVASLETSAVAMTASGKSALADAQELSGKLKQTEAWLSAAQAQVVQLTAVAAENGNARETSAGQVNALQSTIANLQSQVSSLQTNLGVLESAKSVAVAEVQQMQARVAQQTSRLEALDEDKQKLDAQLMQERQQRMELQVQLKQVASDSTRATQTQNEERLSYERASSQHERDVSLLKAQLQSCTFDLQSAKTQLNEQVSTERTLRAEMDKLYRDHQRLQNELTIASTVQARLAASSPTPAPAAAAAAAVAAPPPAVVMPAPAPGPSIEAISQLIRSELTSQLSPVLRHVQEYQHYHQQQELQTHMAQVVSSAVAAGQASIAAAAADAAKAASAAASAQQTMSEQAHAARVASTQPPVSAPAVALPIPASASPQEIVRMVSDCFTSFTTTVTGVIAREMLTHQQSHAAAPAAQFIPTTATMSSDATAAIVSAATNAAHAASSAQAAAAAVSQAEMTRVNRELLLVSAERDRLAALNATLSASAERAQRLLDTSQHDAGEAAREHQAAIHQLQLLQLRLDAANTATGAAEGRMTTMRADMLEERRRMEARHAEDRQAALAAQATLQSALTSAMDKIERLQVELEAANVRCNELQQQLRTHEMQQQFALAAPVAQPSVGEIHAWIVASVGSNGARANGLPALMLQHGEAGSIVNSNWMQALHLFLGQVQQKYAGRVDTYKSKIAELQSTVHSMETTLASERDQRESERRRESRARQSWAQQRDSVLTALTTARNSTANSPLVPWATHYQMHNATQQLPAAAGNGTVEMLAAQCQELSSQVQKLTFQKRYLAVENTRLAHIESLCLNIIDQADREVDQVTAVCTGSVMPPAIHRQMLTPLRRFRKGVLAVMAARRLFYGGSKYQHAANRKMHDLQTAYSSMNAPSAKTHPASWLLNQPARQPFATPFPFMS